MTRHILHGHAADVAPRLLGATIHAGTVVVRLTEVEAYGGVGEDPGSHAFRRLTPRNATMFGRPGVLYQYFTYGTHWMLNCVTSPEGTAGAVLLRAGRVIDGHAVPHCWPGPSGSAAAGSTASTSSLRTPPSGCAFTALSTLRPSSSRLGPAWRVPGLPPRGGSMSRARTPSARTARRHRDNRAREPPHPSRTA
jgi:hypothetical protein